MGHACESWKCVKFSCTIHKNFGPIYAGKQTSQIQIPGTCPYQMAGLTNRGKLNDVKAEVKTFLKPIPTQRF